MRLPAFEATEQAFEAKMSTVLALYFVVGSEHLRKKHVTTMDSNVFSIIALRMLPSLALCRCVSVCVFVSE